MKSRGYRWWILDAENRPVKAKNVIEWAQWIETLGDRSVNDYTEITSECFVSTVFLGVNHRYFTKGPPLLFETMIFGGPKTIDRSQWRYSSWDDAQTGHKAAVRKARAALGQRITAEENK